MGRAYLGVEENAFAAERSKVDALSLRADPLSELARAHAGHARGALCTRIEDDGTVSVRASKRDHRGAVVVDLSDLGEERDRQRERRRIHRHIEVSRDPGVLTDY